jgi:hypothetical protein
VAPSAPTYSTDARRLVAAVRALPAPFYVGVGGGTVGFVGLEHSLGTHLPLVLGAVIASTLIVLFLMTGSVVLGVKAVLMNALTLSAVFGILVLIFQHGRLEGLLSYRSDGALDATQPILLFAIGFGLATDYAVILLSRIKEAHDSGIPNSRAVAIGLERTGRIVTARRAALRGRDRRLRDVEARLHQARPRNRARRVHRRIGHPRPARTVADGPARQMERVGAPSPAPTLRAHIGSSTRPGQPAFGTRD